MPEQTSEYGCLNYYVYILRCSDNTFYTGYTKNIDERLKQHRSGVGARYVRSRQPLQLVYLEQMIERRDAMRREREIKKMNRKQKEELANRIHNFSVQEGLPSQTCPQPSTSP